LYRTALRIVKAGKRKEVFFFEKKPKNFYLFRATSMLHGWANGRKPGAKVFCFFFSKKKYFLSSAYA